MSDPFSALVRYAIYPLWMAKDRSPEPRYLRELRRSQFLSSDEVASLQWKKLKAMLAHAHTTSPYYRMRFREAGIAPQDIKEPADYRHVPLLTKQDVQQHGDEMISDAADRERLIEDRTGGSTGAPLVFFYDRDRLASRQAATIRHNEWAHWRVGDKVAVLWAAPRDIPAAGGWKRALRRHLLTRTTILNAAGITEKRMDAFTDAIRKHRPRVLLGYSSTMALYARYLAENDIKDIRPTSVVCSAEVLGRKERETIERALGCPVFNRYGCREFAVVASECEHRDGMHVNSEHLYLEIGEREASNGSGGTSSNMGEIIITDLSNYAMPLIRYRIMDIARSIDQPCECGRGLSRIEMGEGRLTDFIVTPDQVAVSGVALATYVVPAIPGLLKIQIEQTEVSRIQVKAVAEAGQRMSVPEALSKKLREYLGDEIVIAVQLVEDIPGEQSGKFRFVKSSLPPDSILAAAHES